LIVKHLVAPLIICAAFTGLAAPALAQVDIAGEWAGRLHEDQPARSPGPLLGDYLGFPITDAARLNADTWESSLLSLKEHQAHQYTSVLAFYAPGGKRISKVIDPSSQRVTAYAIHFGIGMAPRTIWMDGRAHPPEYAAHTWAGFSTGRWEGRMLVVTTTHMKAGYLARNGIRHTDRATMVEYFARHGDFLTVNVVVEDPGYLEEPLVWSWSLALNPDQQLPPLAEVTAFEEVAGQRKGYVPHYLPGTNPFLHEFATLTGLPFHATRGGRETMYPEYAARHLRGVQVKAIKEAPADAAVRLGVVSVAP
jgi:hypothetical protein